MSETLTLDCHTSNTTLTSKTYSKVFVLLPHWPTGTEESDFHSRCAAETSDLAAVFENLYGHKTETTTFSRHGPTPTDGSLKDTIARFVERNDGPSILMIVYYNGNATCGPPGSGVFFLNGSRAPSGDDDDLDPRDGLRASWDEGETSLRNAKADVLELLDCHGADTVVLSLPISGANDRLFETMMPGGPRVARHSSRTASFQFAGLNSFI